MDEPKILQRRETRVSPWVRVVAKEVDFARGGRPEIYHCLAQADYIAILARTHGGLIPLVGQYRPAVEEVAWELPAGLLEAGESPEAACRRELKEETGLEALQVHALGEFFPDTGRLENRLHVFFVEASDPDPAFVPEEGLTVEFVDLPTLHAYVLRGRFRHQLHIGVLACAYVHRLLSLTDPLAAAA